MTIGGSLVLIAIGAILKFAVTATVAGIDIGTVGVVLMVVGVIAFIISIIWLANQRRRTSPAVVEQRRTAGPTVTERTYRDDVDERRVDDPSDPRI